MFLLASGAYLLWMFPGAEHGSEPEQAPIKPFQRDSVFRPTVIEPSVLDKTAIPPIATDVRESENEGASYALPAETAKPALQLGAWKLDQFGITIPAAAQMIELDGIRLPVGDLTEWSRRVPLPLVLPRGIHRVRFRAGGPARLVAPRRWFWDVYREAMAKAQQDGKWSFELLIQFSQHDLDRFTDPLVPHFWGNFFWQEGDRAAAARHYRWALHIVPTFAPSYFNLAQFELERGNQAEAVGYLRLADLWNAQNAYGLNIASAALWSKLPVEQTNSGPVRLIPIDTILAQQDRDMVATLRSAAAFATRATEHVKILNNLGAYFEHIGRPELALEHYRAAVVALEAPQLDADQRRVLRAVFQNMARVCRNADMAESIRYERLQAMLEP